MEFKVTVYITALKPGGAELADTLESMISTNPLFRDAIKRDIQKRAGKYLRKTLDKIFTLDEWGGGPIGTENE